MVESCLESTGLLNKVNYTINKNVKLCVYFSPGIVEPFSIHLGDERIVPNTDKSTTEHL